MVAADVGALLIAKWLRRLEQCQRADAARRVGQVDKPPAFLLASRQVRDGALSSVEDDGKLCVTTSNVCTNRTRTIELDGEAGAHPVELGEGGVGMVTTDEA